MIGFLSWAQLVFVPLAVSLIAALPPMLIAIDSLRKTRVKAVEVGAAVEVVRDSVGVQNGHGTVQDATAKILDELGVIRDRQRSQELTLRSIVDATGTVSDRLKAHDREFAETRRRLVMLEGEIDG